MVKENIKNVIFMGDSLTWGGSWQQWFPDYRIHNFGVCGEKTSQIIERLDDAILLEPDVLFMMMGINDLGDGLAVDDIMTNWKALVEQVENALPNTQVVVQSLLPVNTNLFCNPRVTAEKILNVNKELRRFSEMKMLSFIDLYPLFVDHAEMLNETVTKDGLHLNDNGYELWQEKLESFFKQNDI
ncbi:hypothetical protein DMA11_07660 [Marinilabiliaceae bacterium JC017]|nr:hypothetical protein DMA11_07660 [Marinilabiliaceae bacterium JC017]